MVGSQPGRATQGGRRSSCSPHREVRPWPIPAVGPGSPPEEGRSEGMAAAATAVAAMAVAATVVVAAATAAMAVAVRVAVAPRAVAVTVAAAVEETLLS